MPNPVDLSLIVIMVISAFLAMVRGFIREILSLAGWAAAAGAAILAYLRLTGPAVQFFSGANETLVKAATVVTIAVVTLIVVTIITTRISDKVLDSKIGALDRTLGVLFGLGRGLVLVAVAFTFYAWFAMLNYPESCQTEARDRYACDARSRGALDKTTKWLKSLMPENLDVYISEMLNRFKKGNKRDEEDTPGAQPNQRSDLGTRGLAAQPVTRIMRD